MRIFIVSQYFWPEQFIVNGLVEELVSRKHEVQVLTGLPNYPVGKFFKNYSLFEYRRVEFFRQSKVFRVPIFPRLSNKVSLALNYLSFVVSACLFGLFGRVDEMDIIFCYAPSPITSCLPALLMGWWYNKPVVLWVQDLWPESVEAVGVATSNFTKRLIGQLVTFIYKHCDILMVPSKSFNASMVSWGAVNSKIEYIPNWSDPFIKSENTPDWVGLLPTGFRIGFAGNIGLAQDLKTLIEAAKILKANETIKWIVAGEGSEKKFLEDEIQMNSLQNHVICVGKKDYSDMQSFFESCDLLYVSLLDRPIFSFTIPAKVQAYMSSGKPILGSISGEGCRTIMDAKCGICVDPESPKLLAEAVLKFVDLRQDEKEQMGKNALNYFKANFERAIVISKIETLFLNLIAKREHFGS